jgi:hypothetical protein
VPARFWPANYGLEGTKHRQNDTTVSISVLFMLLLPFPTTKLVREEYTGAGYSGLRRRLTGNQQKRRQRIIAISTALVARQGADIFMEVVAASASNLSSNDSAVLDT